MWWWGEGGGLLGYWYSDQAALRVTNTNIELSLSLSLSVVIRPAVNFIKLSATYNPCLAGQTMPGPENGRTGSKLVSTVPVILTAL